MSYSLIFNLFFSVLVLFLGVFVYLRRKDKTSLIFFFLCLSMSVWAAGVIFLIFPFFIGNVALSKLAFAGASFLGATLLYFVQVFPKEKYLPKIINVLLIGSLVSISFLSIFSGLIVKNVEYEDSVIINKEYGVLYPAFGILFILSLILSVIFSFLKHKTLQGIEKKQSQYLLTGLFISFVLATFTNLICPLFKIGPLNVSQYGPISLIFFIVFSALAITRYHLFDIKVILTELLVGSIGLILFVQSIVAETLWQKVFGLGLFSLFCVSGYFLIRSVLKEIELRKELEKAYGELKKLDDAKTEFLSIASHQLRSPLTVIKGYISMALSGNYGKVEGKAKGFLENVYISSERLIDLVNNFLNITRIQMGKMKFDFEDIQIEDIIEDTVKDFLLQAKEKGLSLKFEKPILPKSQAKKLPKIKADSQKIRQVILNLIDNSIKYTKEGGIKVSVKLKSKSKKIQIIIEDTGIGLKKEEVNDIFKMFDRGAEAPQINTGGSGVGLYVAKEMVKAHKGRIWAEPRKKGSRFIVELPVLSHE